jgi:hypothetical protein
MISIGLDIGREHDPAALAVLMSSTTRPASHRPLWRAVSISTIPLGTSYRLLAETTVNIANEFQETGQAVVVTVDATGVGSPVIETMREIAPTLHIVGVKIAGGRSRSMQGPDDYVVGKHLLTEVLQVALEQHGIEWPPGTTEHDELHKQMASFVTKTTATGYQRHEAAGDGHDDLVLATELALWTGDTMADELAGVTPA